MTYLIKGMLMTAMVFAVAMASLKPALARACKPEAFEGAEYIVCAAEAGKTDLRLFWKKPDGEPYRDFSRLADVVNRAGHVLTFAMNAGMYSTDFSPMGLYVEDGRELQPANISEAEAGTRPVPNFFKKPNGVFFFDGTSARILPTDEFLKLRAKIRFATQSGPMLVIRNRLHPAFIPGSTDRTRRSGVGICGDGAIRFAVSEDRVNFHDFARLFKDHLKCPNALFLDGGRGVGLYDPALGRNDRSGHGGYGPILGIME